MSDIITPDEIYDVEIDMLLDAKIYNSLIQKAMI